MKHLITNRNILHTQTFYNFKEAVFSGDFRAASEWLRHGWILMRNSREERELFASPQERKARAQSGWHVKRARYLLSKWRLAAALTHADAAIAHFPKSCSAYQVKSFIHEVMGDTEAARMAALGAWKANPINSRAVRLMLKHGLQDASGPSALSVMAELNACNWRIKAVGEALLSLLELGETEAALALLREAERRRALTDRDQRNMFWAETLRQARRFPEAIPRYTVLTRQKAHRHRALMGRAECHFELGNFAEAEADACAAAEARLLPGPRGFNNVLYHVRFHNGRCREAFLESRHRPFTFALQQDTKGCYTQSIKGLKSVENVVVVADYGVGDEIRFASIYPDLPQYLPPVTATCDPRLQSLFARSFPEMIFLPVARWREESIVREGGSREGISSQRLTPHVSRAALDLIESAGAFTSIFDLLAELRQKHADFGRRKAYLAADPMLTRHWRTQIAQEGVVGQPNVALSWRSLLQDASRNIHYLTPANLEPLSRVQATFWLFQPRLSEVEVAMIRQVLPQVRLIENLDLVDDFEGQAAFLSCMDAAITPCTTAGELAGALGVPTLMFGRTEGARARLYPDGTDIWHPSVRGIVATPTGDPQATAEELTRSLAWLFAAEEKLFRRSIAEAHEHQGNLLVVGAV